MATAPLWNPKLGDLPQLRKLAQPNYSDKDIDWMSERVRHYVRQGSQVVYAIDRAKTDFRKLNS